VIILSQVISSLHVGDVIACMQVGDVIHAGDIRQITYFSKVTSDSEVSKPASSCFLIGLSTARQAGVVEQVVSMNAQLLKLIVKMLQD